MIATTKISLLKSNPVLCKGTNINSKLLIPSPTREEREKRDKEKKEKRAEELRQLRSQQAPQQESVIDKSNLCIECEDTPGQVRCEQCGEIYCDLCFKSQHRKGNRAQHRSEKIEISQLIQVEHFLRFLSLFFFISTDILISLD